MTHRTSLMVLALAASTVVLLAIGSASADGRGVCVRAEIEQTIVLPDGSTHPPGQIRICLDREPSPVSGLHEVSIDRNKVGLFMSRQTASAEAPADDRAKLVFRRGPQGTLSFLGYTVRHQDRMLVYWMRPPKSPRRSNGTLTAHLDLPTLLRDEPDGVLVVTAQGR